MSKGIGKTLKSQHEDEMLVTDFLTDKSGAFDRLVLKYRDMVFNSCYRMLGDYDDANDCAQDIFIKVFKNLKSFKFNSSFSTWLYRIVTNSCKNRLASLDYRMKQKKIRIDGPDNPGDGTNKIEISNGSFSPEAVYEKKETFKIIQDAINTLPGNQKVLVLLRDIEGRSYSDISDITGLKLGTVKSKLARARNTLKDKLKGVI